MSQLVAGGVGWEHSGGIAGIAGGRNPVFLVNHSLLVGGGGHAGKGGGDGGPLGEREEVCVCVCVVWVYERVGLNRNPEA
jgi:hypothetical protein